MFSYSDEFNLLKKIAYKYINILILEERWDNISKLFYEWELSFAGLNSSLLSHKMYFIQLLFQEFPFLHTYANKEIVDIILPDSCLIGQELSIKQTEGYLENVCIVGREITERGGLLLTLEKPDKTRYTYEFIE
jgi:hypothetical protein